MTPEEKTEFLLKEFKNCWDEQIQERKNIDQLEDMK